ncbi:MAG: hypothetical protein U1U88_002030 [Lawsonella clevelandensis]
MPTFIAADANDRSEYWQQLTEHLTELKAIELEEKLRLMYVGVTRSERSPVAHWTWLVVPRHHLS